MPSKKVIDKIIRRIADAIQEINIDGIDKDVTLAHDEEFVTLSVTEDVDEDHKPTSFQKKNGGAIGLYFDFFDGEEWIDGGCFNGYLSNNSEPLPRRTALRAARDIIESIT